MSGLHACLASSQFLTTKEGSIGILSEARQNTLQWFAVSLLNGRLPYLKAAETPVVVETTEEDLFLTFAAGDASRLNTSALQSSEKVSVFGEEWELVVVRLAGLGVLAARQAVLTRSQPAKEWAASPCVNPVVDRWWEYAGHRYHVRGLHKSVEEIKERNGPFAGKRVCITL